MNKLFNFLFLIPIIIVGCKNREVDDQIISQSINSLNMNIFSNEGKKLITIKSPYSKYNKETNAFNLKETTIILFDDNEIEYIINSDNSKLSDNNKLLELSGNVLLKTLNEDGDKLYANSFTWNIINSEYLLDGNVKFENNSVSLRSNNNESSYEINSENALYNINTKSVIFSSKKEKVRSKIYL